MKKVLFVSAAIAMCFCMLLTSCTTTFDKKPDEYTKIRWYAPDYSFFIYPDKDCKGTYTFDGKTYNIQALFSASSVKILDTDKNNAELFNGLWKYDDDKLFIYNIFFNKEAYKEFETNYAEFVRLNREKWDK